MGTVKGSCSLSGSVLKLWAAGGEGRGAMQIALESECEGPVWTGKIGTNSKLTIGAHADCV